MFSVACYRKRCLPLNFRSGLRARLPFVHLLRASCITIPAMNVAAAVRKPLIAISLAILLAFSALAQTATPPDLSGSWVLNLAKSKLGKHATIGSETIVITCPNSTIQFHNTTDGKESTVIYIPDGK